MSDLICGKTQEQIREAYFKRKLNALLNDILAKSEPTEVELSELDAFLALLKNEEMTTVKGIISKYQDADCKPPTVDELREKMTEEKAKKLEDWLVNSQITIKRVKEIMFKLREKVKQNVSISHNVWLESALEIISLLPILDQERVYRDQLYRERLTGIIDTYGVSRAEAEERAKLTIQYRDYKTATLFRENIEEFIMLSKKLGSNQSF